MTRRAFTLVELLVTISIIAIMATLLLFAMYNAQDQARLQKTRSTIAKLHNAIIDRWEGFNTRRLPINIPAGTSPQASAKLRVDALRELMRLELPDRWSDIGSVSGGYVVPSPKATAVPISSLALSYLRRFSSCEPFNDININGYYDAGDSYTDKNGNGIHDTPSVANERAECLYLIITSAANDDENGRESFGSAEVGDTDGDGMSEFLDAWKTPIRFLRWAPGFNSELQTQNPTTQPDPFDPRHVYPNGSQADITFALTPLVYSAGPDQGFDIYGGGNAFVYGSANNNPFVGLIAPNNFPNGQIGGRVDIDPTNGTDESGDNIHNHLIGLK